jgi:hypothetical protein
MQKKVREAKLPGQRLAHSELPVHSEKVPFWVSRYKSNEQGVLLCKLK